MVESLEIRKRACGRFVCNRLVTERSTSEVSSALAGEENTTQSQSHVKTVTVGSTASCCQQKMKSLYSRFFPYSDVPQITPSVINKYHQPRSILILLSEISPMSPPVFWVSHFTVNTMMLHSWQSLCRQVSAISSYILLRRDLAEM